MKNNVRPTGIKGDQINERMKELMGINTLSENHSISTVELAKIGPDGKAYGIVKENQKYFIKICNKTNEETGQAITENLSSADFDYQGGLVNKHNCETYSSYSEATKHMNLKFLSIKESLGVDFQFDIKNEGLLENADMEGLEDVAEDKETSGDNVATKDAEKEWEKEKSSSENTGKISKNSVGKAGHTEKYVMKESVEMTDNELAIDEMINPTPVVVKEVKKGIKINHAMENMDDIINEVTNSSDKVDNIMEGLSDSDARILQKALNEVISGGVKKK